MNNLAYQDQGSGRTTPSCPSVSYALPSHYPARLEALLAQPVSSEMGVTRLEDGTLRVKTNQSDYLVTDPVPPRVPSHSGIPILVMGIGDGSIVEQYLRSHENPILVIEPALSLLEIPLGLVHVPEGGGQPGRAGSREGRSQMQPACSQVPAWQRSAAERSARPVPAR